MLQCLRIANTRKIYKLTEIYWNVFKMLDFEPAQFWFGNNKHCLLKYSYSWLTECKYVYMQTHRYGFWSMEFSLPYFVPHFYFQLKTEPKLQQGKDNSAFIQSPGYISLSTKQSFFFFTRARQVNEKVTLHLFYHLSTFHWVQNNLFFYKSQTSKWKGNSAFILSPVYISLSTKQSFFLQEPDK